MVKIKRILYCIVTGFIASFARIAIDGWYGGFWQFRKILRGGVFTNIWYYKYMKDFESFIGINAKFHTPPTLPHGLNGIHISDHAVIGANCVIFQQVTIGSNTIKNHKRFGSPTIGDNVLIGTGAKVIGNINIGNNCRIGANCVVTEDIPSDMTVVCVKPRTLVKQHNDNSYTGIND